MAVKALTRPATCCTCGGCIMERCEPRTFDTVRPASTTSTQLCQNFTPSPPSPVPSTPCARSLGRRKRTSGTSGEGGRV